MNLRTSLTIILATVTTLCSSAQFSIGLEFGGVRNTLDTDTGYAYDLRYDGRNGPTVGIAFGYDFNDWFALRAAPTYIQKGYKMHRTGIYEGVTPGEIMANPTKESTKRPATPTSTSRSPQDFRSAERK